METSFFLFIVVSSAPVTVLAQRMCPVNTCWMESDHGFCHFQWFTPPLRIKSKFLGMVWSLCNLAPTYSLTRWFLMGAFRLPLPIEERYLATSADSFGCHNCGGGAGIQWTEARMQLESLHCTGQAPQRGTWCRCPQCCDRESAWFSLCCTQSSRLLKGHVLLASEPLSPLNTSSSSYCPCCWLCSLSRWGLEAN